MAKNYAPQSFVIGNPESFEAKKKALIADGISHLHIISDFDRTLTTGATSSTSFALVEHSKLLSDQYRARALALFEKYHPIELNHTIPYEDRLAAMVNWWKEAEIAMTEEGLNKEIFYNIVNGSKLVNQYCLIIFLFFT